MNAAVIPPLNSITSARRALASAFRAAGLDTPDLDARILVGHALGLDHAALAATERALVPHEAYVVNALAQRRLVHEPVARIVGEKEFWGLTLRVTPDVLVPRPDTETVVEAALAAIDGNRKDAALRIADLGTGSGALLLALLHELPNANGVGTDCSPEALAVARDNAAHHGVAARAQFTVSDYGRALTGQFDLVVSNPPYIPSRDIAALAPDVRDFDPHLALDGGADGLAAYREIAADAPRFLRPGGFIVVEIGIGQAAAVTTLVVNAGFAGCHSRRDLASIERAIVAQYPCR